MSFKSFGALALGTLLTTSVVTPTLGQSSDESRLSGSGAGIELATRLGDAGFTAEAAAGGVIADRSIAYANTYMAYNINTEDKDSRLDFGAKLESIYALRQFGVSASPMVQLRTNTKKVPYGFLYGRLSFPVWQRGLHVGAQFTAGLDIMISRKNDNRMSGGRAYYTRRF